MKGPIQAARFKRTQKLRTGPKSYFRGTDAEWQAHCQRLIFRDLFGSQR